MAIEKKLKGEGRGGLWTIIKDEFGQVTHDKRFYEGLGIDALGYVNYFGYLLGPEVGVALEVLDPIVGGFQVARIEKMYGTELTTLEKRILQGIGFLEETLPWTDLIPTMTLTRLYIAAKDIIREYKTLQRTKPVLTLNEGYRPWTPGFQPAGI